MTRYLPLSDDDRRLMLKKIGVDSVDEFFAAVPQSARLNGKLDLPAHKSELETERWMASLAERNRPAGAQPFFCGAGAYRHHLPASVDHIIQRSEFLTAYTPYQPEIAQGTLQVLFEFQSQVAILTAMDIANASIYDGSTASAEAVLMAHRLVKRSKAVISRALHPHYRATIKTLSDVAGLDVIETDDPKRDIDGETDCVVVQNPDFFGELSDYTALAQACHAQGALLIIVITEIISLGLVRPPGEMGADIVAAEGQSLGNALSFGGPYVGLLAARQFCLRQMPGRLCGVATDARARRGYVLTLAAREQHIRREKATSNICTSAGLCTLAFSAHLALLGGEGLRNLAIQNHLIAKKLAAKLDAIDGVRRLTDKFFNEFTIETNMHGAKLIDALLARDILGGVPIARLLPEDERQNNRVLIAATEMNSDSDIAALAQGMEEILQ